MSYEYVDAKAQFSTRSIGNFVGRLELEREPELGDQEPPHAGTLAAGVLSRA